MTQETVLDVALKSVVQTTSKKRQTDIIADYTYSKYDVFKCLEPLTVGIGQDLVVVLPQFNLFLIAHVLTNHYCRPCYLKSLARSGKRFDLNNRFKGRISPEKQAIAQWHPAVQ